VEGPLGYLEYDTLNKNTLYSIKTIEDIFTTIEIVLVLMSWFKILIKCSFLSNHYIGSILLKIILPVYNFPQKGGKSPGLPLDPYMYIQLFVCKKNDKHVKCYRPARSTSFRAQVMCFIS
jgi:hypothetical protein